MSQLYIFSPMPCKNQRKRPPNVLNGSPVSFNVMEGQLWVTDSILSATHDGLRPASHKVTAALRTSVDTVTVIHFVPSSASLCSTFTPDDFKRKKRYKTYLFKQVIDNTHTHFE